MSRCWHVLTVQKKELFCSDEVDETKSSNKWHKKAAEQLEKLNKDCNNTAGLQAVVKVAVGARVMLRRNIDTKGGLVNGSYWHYFVHIGQVHIHQIGSCK